MASSLRTIQILCTVLLLSTIVHGGTGTKRIIGYSVEQRPIECDVLGNGDDAVLFIGSIHGNENAGTPLLQRLATFLKENPHVLRRKQAVIIHTLNPDGLIRNKRYNARGVDLNRNFPAQNRENSRKHGEHELSEPEAGALAQLIKDIPPARIVSLHQAVNVIDYDGPGKALAEHMGRYCMLPVKQLSEVQEYPGSLGNYAGIVLNIPIVTFELPIRIGTLDHEPQTLWEEYGAALLAAIAFPELVPAEYIPRAK